MLKADKARMAALKREVELLAALDAEEDDVRVAELNQELEHVYVLRCLAPYASCCHIPEEGTTARDQQCGARKCC